MFKSDYKDTDAKSELGSKQTQANHVPGSPSTTKSIKKVAMIKKQTKNQLLAAQVLRKRQTLAC
jgi:hypothetical protein